MRHHRYRTEGQVIISMTVVITKNMLPSFRLIAYYHPNDNEVVSDSVWVDVKDSCMGSVRHMTLMSNILRRPTMQTHTKINKVRKLCLILSVPPPLAEAGIIKTFCIL